MRCKLFQASLAYAKLRGNLGYPVRDDLPSDRAPTEEEFEEEHSRWRTQIWEVCLRSVSLRPTGARAEAVANGQGD